jgi:galactokinase
MIDHVKESETFHLEVFGTKPKVLAFAPGRTNIIGEHIDYNDGIVLPFAISQGVYSGISRNETDSDKISSRNRSGEIIEIPVNNLDASSYPHWASYIIGALVEVRKLAATHEGLSISIASDLPEGAGLSSSAALECSVLIGLLELYNIEMSEMDIAKLAQKIEHEFAGSPCGLMDQVASIFGRKGSAISFDVLNEEISYVECDPANDGFDFFICDTNIPHELASSEYVVRRSQCESAAQKLGIKSLRTLKAELPSSLLNDLENKRVGHVTSEIGRVERVQEILTRSSWIEIGQLMGDSHRSLRDDYEVSIPAIDAAVQAAVDAGASGARIVGGGFGGSILVLSRQVDSHQIIESMSNALSLFGSTPRFLTVEPSQGAQVLYAGSAQ